MPDWKTLQFRVRSHAMMARIVELFEQEAERLEDDETALYWREMSRICAQQVAGRAGKLRVARPVLAWLRPDVIERVAYGPPPYDLLTKAEAQEVCRLLTREGRRPTYIADRVMVHERTISRWVARDKNKQ